MRKVYFSFFAFLFCVGLVAQEAPGKYWVAFTDKADSPYAVTRPSEFLSQRAIERRTRLNIPVVENDLPVNPRYIQEVLDQGNVRLLNRSKWFNAITIESFDTAALAAINTLPFVKIGPVFNSFKKSGAIIAQKFGEQSPGEILEELAEQNNLLDYGTGINQVDMLEVQFLHNLGYTGEGVVIAVLDNGFLGTDTMELFQRLYDNGQILGGYDFVDIDTDPFDAGTHGTRVLSAIGGWWPGTMIGTAPDAQYWLLKSEETGSEYRIEEANWVSAAEFADSAGADIINSSLGYTVFEASFQNHSYADMNGDNTLVTRGADMAASKGILVVASAGNSGQGSWKYLVAPSDGDSVFSVGAVTFSERPAAFTSRGPSFDGRVKPNIAAKGVQTFVAVGDSVDQQQGTSFSAPLITGGAACLLQAYPGIQNTVVMEALERSGSRYLTPDTLVGHGVPDFRTAFELIRDIRERGADQLNAFPNPFQEEVTLQLFSILDQTVSVEISDLTGRTVYSESWSVVKGKNVLPIALQVLPAGPYIIHARSLTEDLVTTVVRLK